MTDWIIEKHHFNNYKWYSVKEGEREIAECENLQDAELIVSLHNNASKVGNPLKVAESIPEMYEALKKLLPEYERILKIGQPQYHVIPAVAEPYYKAVKLLNKLEEE